MWTLSLGDDGCYISKCTAYTYSVRVCVCVSFALQPHFDSKVITFARFEVECHHLILFTVILKNVYGELYQYKKNIVVIIMILTQYDY